MENIVYRQNISYQYCFPDNNSSCRKEVNASSGNIFLYIFLSCISVCTVFLNLLVIISISHFKQLHTPTNLLILSLAVADLLVGLFVMPLNIMQLIDTCWYFGKLACSISVIISFVPLLGSVWSMVLIAVDRYIAVNDPLLYSSRITVHRMSMCIIIFWTCSVVYITVYMYFNDHLLPSQMMTSCYGECVLVIKNAWVMVDLVVTFLSPCFLILMLYLYIFCVARRQAKAVRAERNGASYKCRAKVSRSSETKAAKKLGTIIFVYLACWIPFYISSLTVDSLTSSTVAWAVFTWLLCINSSVNPLIYAIFYPWFQTSAKLIVTCKIFGSSSSRTIAGHI